LFRTLYKIIRGAHVTATELSEHCDLIKYFGLNSSSILVDLATEMDQQAVPASAAPYDDDDDDDDMLWGNDDGESATLYDCKTVLINFNDGRETIEFSSPKTTNEYVEVRKARVEEFDQTQFMFLFDLFLSLYHQEFKSTSPREMASSLG
jgi:hypothetical protein